jgi:hypothetical protein
MAVLLPVFAHFARPIEKKTAGSRVPAVKG